MISCKVFKVVAGPNRGDNRLYTRTTDSLSRTLELVETDCTEFKMMVYQLLSMKD